MKISEQRKISSQPYGEPETFAIESFIQGVRTVNRLQRDNLRSVDGLRRAFCHKYSTQAYQIVLLGALRAIYLYIVGVQSTLHPSTLLRPAADMMV